MTEVLFILTTVFVAYVVYAVVTDQNNTIKTLEKETGHSQEAEKTTVAAVATTAATAVAVTEKPKPAAKKAAAPAKKSTPAKAAEPAAVEGPRKPGLRNPETGEVATSYSNYRFAKRWVKDALVAEGLVDKVYKTTELDDAVETRIKAAMAKLEAMDKYKV
ncbi:MAG: hypothetical protein CTY29_07825 [Methylobacter sp.]|nr:MAG: hypothetical protein CTY29_07825 [Methylobacter sp.]